MKEIHLSLFNSYRDTTPNQICLYEKDAEKFFKTNHKHGSAFCMAKFRDGGRRSASDVTHMTGIVFDFDYKVPMSVSCARDKMDAILGVFSGRGITHFWYKTKSYTEEMPRFRVVVPLEEPVLADDWRKIAARSVKWLREESRVETSGVLDPCIYQTSQIYLLPH